MAGVTVNRPMYVRFVDRRAFNVRLIRPESIKQKATSVSFAGALSLVLTRCLIVDIVRAQTDFSRRRTLLLNRRGLCALHFVISFIRGSIRPTIE